jgi:hypothetical protein
MSYIYIISFDPKKEKEQQQQQAKTIFIVRRKENGQHKEVMNNYE